MLDNNPPRVNTDTDAHSPRRPSRATPARVAIPTASTASTSASPDGTNGATNRSNTTAHAQKNPVTGPAIDRNRRSHPRTVDAGTPNRPAIRR